MSICNGEEPEAVAYGPPLYTISGAIFRCVLVEAVRWTVWEVAPAFVADSKMKSG